MTIYTRTGDKGKTSLRTGKRVSKSNIRVETYGTVDELNAMIGLAIAETSNKQIKDQLVMIQNDLFELGANLANPNAKNSKKLNEFLKKRVMEFEKEIDEITQKLPQITHFILPGGSNLAVSLHLCRTFCRRAERRVVELSGKQVVDENVIMYLNRLSDLFFALARHANFLDKEKETYWVEKIK